MAPKETAEWFISRDHVFSKYIFQICGNNLLGDSKIKAVLLR